MGQRTFTTDAIRNIIAMTRNAVSGGFPAQIVRLAALDAAIKKNDLKLMDAARRDTISIAGRRLSCNPPDGSAWLRCAKVEVLRSGPVPRAIDALGLSYWSAPGESWVVE